jgi:FAD/FMN-containing dehydrogenase
MSPPADIGPEWLASFRDILGADGVLDADADLARYQEDARSGCGRAAAVLRPASAADVAHLLVAAHRHGLHLVPQGANTGLTGASIPDESGRQVVLSAERLCDRIDIDVENRTATVGAGVRLSALNEAAAAHGLTFPIDLAADPSVGGMVAANTGGARFIRYGDVRRNVLGLEVVLADGKGTVLDLTRPLWKNNAGLDLKQLFIGTGGAFGMITRAVLALHPEPRCQIGALLTPSSNAATPGILVALERGLGPLLTAFEGMSRNAMEMALRHVPGVRNPFANGEVPAYALLVELSAPFGDEVLLQDALEQALSPLLNGQDPPLADALIGGAEALWRLRHAIPEALRREGEVIGCDIALARGTVPRFLEAARSEIARRWPGVIVCDFGHVGDGGVHFNLVAPPGALGADGPEAVRSVVYDLAVTTFDGTFSAEHGLGPRNIADYARLVPDEERRAAAQIQQALANRPFGRFSLAAPAP